MVPHAFDRTCWTYIQAAGAAANFISRMCAYRIVKIYVNRFFKFADKLEGFAFKFAYGKAVISLCPQISITLFPTRE
jgi:hypothetical protein